MSDVGIQLCYIDNYANMKFLTLDLNFSQIHSELTFAMTQFASGGRLTPNMCKKTYGRLLPPMNGTIALVSGLQFYCSH